MDELINALANKIGAPVNDTEAFLKEVALCMEGYRGKGDLEKRFSLDSGDLARLMADPEARSYVSQLRYDMKYGADNTLVKEANKKVLREHRDKTGDYIAADLSANAYKGMVELAHKMSGQEAIDKVAVPGDGFSISINLSGQKITAEARANAIARHKAQGGSDTLLVIRNEDVPGVVVKEVDGVIEDE